MKIDPYIQYWANLIRESSDEYNPSELLDEKSPEVNGKSDQRRAGSPRSGSSNVHQQSQSSKPNNDKRTMGDIVAHPVAKINGIIQEYKNGDIEFDFSSVNKVFQKFHKIFGMSYWSGSRYAKIKNGNDIIALRISDHRAIGTYFQKADGDCSRYLSIYIGDESNHVESPIPYTEIRYKPEVFEDNPKGIVDSMFLSLSKFLSGEDFQVDETLGTKTDYQK